MLTKILGKFGEDIAVNYLQKKGYQVLERNWRVGKKEIDIVAQKQKAFIFVEVKTLAIKSSENSNRFLPEEGISPQKRKALLLACQYYLFSKKLDVPWQIDVISVEIDSETKKPKIHHFENEICQER